MTTNMCFYVTILEPDAFIFFMAHNIGILVAILFCLKAIVYTFLYLWFRDPNDGKKPKKPSLIKRIYVYVKSFFVTSTSGK